MATRVLDFTKLHLLRDEDEYRAAVREIDVLLDADPRPGTSAHDRLAFLSVLVEAYEDEHEPPISATDPQDVVLFMLEQQGKTRSELVRILGSKSLVSDFLNRRRDLSINQIRRLVENLRVPAELLLKPSRR